MRLGGTFFLGMGMLGFMWALVSCSTTTGALKISDLDRPLVELQKAAVASLPLGLRRVSDNRREYFSHYFAIKGRSFVEAPPKLSRRYARILILGDRRPYSIEILVYREKPMGQGSFADGGLDKGLAKAIHQRLVRLLNERREGSDIIDDFRAF